MNDSEIESNDQESSEFEEQLKRSLRRIDAPGTLVTRVLERANELNRLESERRPSRGLVRLGWAGAMAAILVLGVFVTNHIRVKRERAHAAEIQTQFDTALRVTNDALDQTRAQLDRAGLNLGN